MNNDDLDSMLSQSKPRTASAHPGVRHELMAVVHGSRAAARRTRRAGRVLAISLPTVLAPTLALGLAAGADQRMVPDFSIPISYDTDTGRHIECTLDFYNGEMFWQETNSATDYLRDQDWSGIGQRIYDRALALLESNDPSIFVSSTQDGALDESLLQRSAWVQAEAHFTVNTIPDSAFAIGGLGSNSDCTGELR